MASLWRKTMLYLGLAPDAEYEDSELDPYQSPAGRAAATLADPDETVGAVRTLAPTTTTREPIGMRNPVGAPTGVDLRNRPSVVRPLPAAPSTRPHKCAPVSFDDAQEIADRFKSRQAVIVNLQGADQPLSRRLIDFASGLCYGLGGQMERVADQVYLLTPADVQVSDDFRRNLGTDAS